MLASAGFSAGAFGKGIIPFEPVARPARYERYRPPFFRYGRKYGREKQSTGDKASHAVRRERSPSGEISEAFEPQQILFAPVGGRPQDCPPQYNLPSHPNPESPSQPKLFQPSLQSPPRLDVGGGPPLLDCSFAARDSFQHSHSILKGFERGHVHQIGSWNSVLGDENRRLIFGQFAE